MLQGFLRAFLVLQLFSFSYSFIPDLNLRLPLKTSKPVNEEIERSHDGFFPSFPTLNKMGVGHLNAISANPSKIKTDVVADYVKDRGGNRVIKKILIANNGMAATKSILSIRQWAYMELGDDAAIQFVAMATPDDLNANAEFVRLADSFVEVPGGSNKNNYANVDLIVKTAMKEGVDAVWPGWGHASENPNLPNTLKEKGIKFIGPTGPVMSVLGDKIAANILAQTAEVPSIPWSGDGLVAKLTEEGTIPDEIFNKAMVTTAEEALAAAEKIGYPVMLKASEGGGGKGIRMSNNAEELATNFVQVSNEVPGSPMFMMQLCTEARHLEVQIVGDEHGNALALNGRDCSTQRRFQKIFEEGPPTIAKPETFRQMEKAAQRLTQSIGYVGAGTVEYLYNAATDKYYFLELNPRLQVEHPVTEGLTLVNLPATQLQVAMGIPLHNVPEIRRFYSREDVYGTDEINFMEEEYSKINSHVIAARITAENPDEGFKPTSGKIERVKFQSTSNVWGYFSVGANGGIHEFADSQFGHLFAKGATREDARKALVLALKEIDVRGDIRTTVEYLVQLLETKEFKENTIDTSWLDGLIREKTIQTATDPEDVAVAAAIARAYARSREEENKFLQSLEKGQVSTSAIKDIKSFPLEITYKDYKYSFQVEKTSPENFELSMNDQTVDVKIREQPDGSLIATYGGEVHTIFSQEEPLGLRMVLDGNTIIMPTVYDPSELRTDVTGKIVRYLQEDGADVENGTPYVEVEAMKMIMPLKTSETGKINHELSPGSIISAGDLLASLSLKDPSKVKKINPFTGVLRMADNEGEEVSREAVIDKLNLVLDGYKHDVNSLAQRLVAGISSYDEIGEAVEAMLEKYVSVEEQFTFEVSDDEAVAALVKSNKDNLRVVLAATMPHRELALRNRLISTLLRQMQTFGEKYGQFRSTDRLKAALTRLNKLQGKKYGEVSIAAQQLLMSCNTSPFAVRLEELRENLLSTQDYDALAKSPTLSAGVDLLTTLFSDSDQKVAAAALEVYIRRVYRTHTVLDLDVGYIDGKSLYAKWNFKFSDTNMDETPTRRGFMTVLPSVDELKSTFKSLAEFSELSENESANKLDEPINVFHIGFSSQMDSEMENNIPDIEELLSSNMESLKKMNIRDVNILSEQRSQNPRYFSFPATNDYKVDEVRRDMRPTFPSLLELTRLSTNFDLTRLSSIGRNTQVYIGTGKSTVGAKKAANQVLFVRGISHTASAQSQAGAERLLAMALDELESASLDPLAASASSSRLFLYVLNEFEAEPMQVANEWSLLVDKLISKFATRLLELKVDEIEVKCRVADGSEATKKIQPLRLMASSMSGKFLAADSYLEYPDPITGVTRQFCSVNDERKNDEDAVCLLNPYPASTNIQTKRSLARRIGSTYAYDFLGLIEVSLIQKWDALGAKVPEQLLRSEELVLDENGELKPNNRLVGLNDIGMVAWHATIRTPEYPEGREVIIIANDVTYQSGSFGVKEDEFFRAASEYARVRGLPRIYLSSNSGARIGLVDELKPKFKIAWNDESNPSLGFKYLYLSSKDYEELQEGTVNAHMVNEDGEDRYVLDDIIGQVHGIGVENLRGSGMIAGETSQAYDDTFTLSYVTGRSVGIGAYLVRLGQRTIQMKNGPLILTGFSALNKLLGREVYTSQDQLGGPSIMYPNGISHLVVNDDKEGISAVLDWLSYVPKDKFSMVKPLSYANDPVNRQIDFVPTKTPYDPRHMLAGIVNPDGTYTSGFFDRDSFTESMAGWGKSVVTGRAKLGGIPMGVIAVETRLVEQRIPADPANPDSREAILPQAGQVWYPDSAFKTAQAIDDFNRGENLPLMVFANWRGFSGGTRDMYGEILKFGAKIVDALRKYQHPVFVYIPPAGELRGGAWVVIDPTINEEMMEMYADKESRGGILEPPGICEVKFRVQDQINAMHRLDATLMDLDAQLAAVSESDVDSAKSLQASIKSREESLLPFYLQVAHEFADLHDRSGRMKAKGVIRDALDWKNSRNYFFWRVNRRLNEDSVIRALQEVDKSITVKEGRDMIKDLSGDAYEEDAAFVEWKEANTEKINNMLQAKKHESLKNTLSSLLGKLTEEEKASILSEL